MDFFSHLLIGFQAAVSPEHLLYCGIGVILGTVIGVLPGVGPTSTIAMLLPITYSLDPSSALIMLAGVYYGSAYGGSTTAILLNLPGEASSAVTAIDGHMMAQNGRAGPALAIAAIGSFVAGTITTALIAVFAVPLTHLALGFGPPEYFSLIVIGLITSVTLSHGSVLKALAMVVLGLMLSLVGTDVYTGVPRFTFGILDLYDGISVVSIAVALFGISEILRNLGSSNEGDATYHKVTSLMPSWQDIRRSAPSILRGTALGTFLGTLPGGGATLSSFASYALERKVSRHGEEFGKGAIEGVAGPESANNAGAQAAFIPMLTLGIPGNAVMAMMVAALIIQGITPGPNIVQNEPRLFWGLIVSMWIGNLFLVLLNLPLVGLWVWMLKVPYAIMFPAIIAFSCIGIFSVQGNVFDIFSVSILGLLGFVLVKCDCEPAPLMLGFVLGPMLEENFRRSMLMSRGDPTILVTHPISACLLLAALILLVVISMPSVLNRRQQIFEEE
jgi:TctA family transporter